MTIVLLVLGWYVLLWLLIGKDPPGRPVAVRYEPPEGLSPAAVGYLVERGYDSRQLTATLMGLARHGVLEIEEREDGDWTVRRIGPHPPTLAPEERAVAETLLPDEDALVIMGISHQRVRKAKRALRVVLRARFHESYFVTNRSWFLCGVLISVVGFTAFVYWEGLAIEASVWNLSLNLLAGSLITARLLTRGFRRWRIDLAEMSPKPSLLSASVLPLLSLLPLGILGMIAHDLSQVVPTRLLVVVLLLSGINALFFELLERPTVEGRELLDQVEGFRRFLSTTEADRIGRLTTEESQRLYERLLPYAVALGLRNRWAALFGDAMNPLVPGS